TIIARQSLTQGSLREYRARSSPSCFANSRSARLAPYSLELMSWKSSGEPLSTTSPRKAAWSTLSWSNDRPVTRPWVGVFDFALRAVGGADDADRITAVALNFEVEGKWSVSDGYLIPKLFGLCNKNLKMYGYK